MVISAFHQGRGIRAETAGVPHPSETPLSPPATERAGNPVLGTGVSHPGQNSPNFQTRQPYCDNNPLRGAWAEQGWDVLPLPPYSRSIRPRPRPCHRTLAGAEPCPRSGKLCRAQRWLLHSGGPGSSPWGRGRGAQLHTQGRESIP